ncbi:MAG: HDOD domain-containing protein [gamma proteobacterium symbiont of Bathyaustriella thionipta]|nr:HDOD domain-containing protein [gamma proteobacterium symbiont of Bathyaustriella thionipta]MCU7951734.1 HDOD domain-containing protein [gamma proteobacterium symbiont of Bathyaustriella thionipta]MCU7958332.1 HDOD domain-containing protein [gamma proteobacterium symbiont of Bathyaustriella thionipta]MCU7966583.1 HDOD domain-containing protein [gamma proteobacterium symbiont of Bathyaustriella thionipta]
MVNSAYFNLPHKVNSIKRAVTILGMSEIRKIALNLLFFKKMIKVKGQQEFEQIFFWQHCLFVATLSKIIAVKINHPDPDMIYSAGLLHDIGKIVLETHGQLTYSELLISFEKSNNSLLDNEHNFFGITHAEIGAVFCHLCDLPESLINVVLNHHRCFNSDKMSTGNKQNIAIVAYADFIAWLQKIGSVEKNHYPTLQPEVSEIINHLNLDIEAILEEVDEEIRNISVFYGIQFPSLNKLRANLVETIFNCGFKGNDDQQICYNENQSKQLPVKKHHGCLTAPHHSLNPDEFIPWTLEAIYHEYHFDRLMILDIDPEHRSLIAKYWRPESIIAGHDKIFEIMISSLSGQLLSCLRNKEAVLINALSDGDEQLLKKLSVNEFFSLPILINNRLSSVLYIDNAVSGKKLDNNLLTELDKITTELGIALVNARQFESEKIKAQIDPLTGLKNKRMIHQFLIDNFEANSVQREQLSVGFIDIDFFKKFNDTYGRV